MIGAMAYHGMPGFVGKTRNSNLLVPKMQVEVPVVVPAADVHHAAGVPGGVAAAAV
jgi:PII-like signaling protein